jgi:outer membrane protein TolC
MKQIHSFLLITLFCNLTWGQELVSLDSCVAWSKQNYPLIKQNEITQHQLELNNKAVNETWIPKLNFSSQATYNSEVVKFSFPGMNIKIPHDQYLTSLSLEQTLLDGGNSKASHRVDQLNADIAKQQNELELYKLIDKVSQLYVNVLLGKENIRIQELYREDLLNRSKNMRFGVENGLVLPSSLDELEAEVLKTEQNLVEANYQLISLFEVLSYYTNKKIDSTTTFASTPLGGELALIEIKRPELTYYSLQSELIDARFKQTNANAIPRITIGAVGNYGRPGPNYMNQNFRFFGSANISLKWNISNLYGLKRERVKKELSKDIFEIQQEVFLFNLQTSLNTQTSQLKAIDEIIQKDDLIIQKREKVTETASAQMENGKITVVNYLTQLTAELQAKLNKRLHEIKRMNTISTINATSGSIKF